MQFKCKECGFEFTRTELPEACPACGDENYEHITHAQTPMNEMLRLNSVKAKG